MKTALLTVVSLLYLPLSAAEPLRRVDGSLEELVGVGKVPGIAAAAILDGKVVAAGVAGLRKVDSLERVELEDRFHIGSCTKSMTASLAAMLVKEDVISWDTTCGEIFKEIEIHPGFKKATLRQFLSNTGGGPGDVPRDLWSRLWQRNGREIEQRMELVQGILTAPPEYPPGESTAYSNAGFSIAGAMLERRTGKRFDELLKQRLFEPLGMESAGFGAPATPGKVDQPYGHVLRAGMLVAVDPKPSGDNPPAISPAGRVHVSILDFVKYANLHLGKTKDVLLDDAQLHVLHNSTPSSGDYALGWVRTEREWAGGTALTHTGTNTMFYALIWVAPEKNFAAVAACNSGEGFAACDAAISMLIDQCLKSKPTAVK